MLKLFSRVLLLTAALAFTSSMAMAAEPTVHDVYAAAEAGHLQEAQTMMQQVLRAHPESAKAHFVEAELYAKANQLDYARRELNTAQRLDPTLGFAKPAAYEALQAKVSAQPASAFNKPRPGFSWVYLLLGVGLVAVVIMFIRALTQRRTMSGAPVPYGAAPAAGYGGGYGPGYPPPGGGMGSGIMGGLVTGAAVGAGMVAGEALASRLMDGHTGEHVNPQPLQADDAGWGNDDRVNGDMGGNDFGVNDDSSWDAGGGDGGDWS